MAAQSLEKRPSKRDLAPSAEHTCVLLPANNQDDDGQRAAAAARAAPQDSPNVFEREERRRIIVKRHALPLIFQSLRNHAAQCKNFSIPLVDKWHRMKDRVQQMRAGERGQPGQPPEKKQKNDDQEEKLQKEADALIRGRNLQVCFTSMNMTGER